MKRKELKNLAQRIANLEIKSREASSPEEAKQAEQEITELTGRVTSLDDIFLLDELIMNILNKNS